tara:strand:- start:71 stop:502 length:432 start_codon:yes stop_codon:yes gene_type:complete
MPSYPAKPFVVPQDDWFNNNSSDFENDSKTKVVKNISTIHEFFYRQSEEKVGGSDNHIQITSEKKSSEKIIISSLRDYDESLLIKREEKYSYSKIPLEHLSIKRRSFRGDKFIKNVSNKNKLKFRSYLLYLKSIFFKIIRRKK